MTALAFVRQLRPLPADRWRVSVNNVAKGPVTGHDYGVRETTAWVRFTFRMDDTEHSIRGEVDGSGAQRVIVDDIEMECGNVVLSNRICGLSVRLVVELRFTRSGEPVRYRFDGRLT